MNISLKQESHDLGRNERENFDTLGAVNQLFLLWKISRNSLINLTTSELRQKHISKLTLQLKSICT